MSPDDPCSKGYFSRQFHVSQGSSQFIFLFFISYSIILPSPTVSTTTAFLFCLSILHAPFFSISTISNACSRFCSFRRRVQVSAPYNATLHTKHFTSLYLFFCRCFPLLYFLTAVQVATDIAPYVFETVPLFDGLIFNSNVYRLWLSSNNHGVHLNYIYLQLIILTYHLAPSVCSSASFHLLLAKPYHPQTLCT